MRIIKETIFNDIIVLENFWPEDILADVKKILSNYGKIYEREIEVESSGPEIKFDTQLDIVKRKDDFTVIVYTFSFHGKTNTIFQRKETILKIVATIETQLKPMHGLIGETFMNFYQDKLDEIRKELKKEAKQTIKEIYKKINDITKKH